MKDNMIKCILCDDSMECNDMFEDHVVSDHMMSYSKYYEYHKLIGESRCDICEEPLYRVSPWFEIYNPCIKCSGNKIYFESAMMNIDKIHNLLCSNRFVKLFILDRDLRERLTKFNIMDYCNSLASIYKNSEIKDDINLFSISTKTGRSPYLDTSLSNINLNKSAYKISKRDLSIHDDHYILNFNGNTYEIYLPEECEYHNNNHYKYNILNRSNNYQSAKKLLLSSGTCVKFYNTNFDRCKSILRVTKNGNDVYSVSLSIEELNYIKFYIMTNSTLLKYILGILYEIIKNSDTIYDYAFILNKVVINPTGKFNMIIDWTINNRMLDSDKELLNMSIL